MFNYRYMPLCMSACEYAQVRADVWETRDIESPWNQTYNWLDSPEIIVLGGCELPGNQT